MASKYWREAAVANKVDLRIGHRALTSCSSTAPLSSCRGGAGSTGLADVRRGRPVTWRVPARLGGHGSHQ